jgi:hypothetical protein
VCVWRTIFLFGDYFSSQNYTIDAKIRNEIDTTIQKEESEWLEIISEEENSPLQTWSIPTSQPQIPSNPKTFSESTKLEIPQKEKDILNLTDFKENDSSNFDDIQTLKNIYIKTKNTSVLNVLLEKFIHNYRFKEAKSYLLTFYWEEYSPDINPSTYLHILINSISSSNTRDIIYLEEEIKQMYQSWFIDRDSSYFYLWLLKIYSKDYNGANNLFKFVNSWIYLPFIQSFQDTFKNPYIQKDIPVYYKDGLIALTMLKNWYFSIAKKIAVHIVIENDKYILPYQILAYSHFLTNEWDPAIDYLFDLVDINPEKEDTYKFFDLSFLLSKCTVWKISIVSFTDKKIKYIKQMCTDILFSTILPEMIKKDWFVYDNQWSDKII